jgi:hypothetical protein
MWDTNKQQQLNALQQRADAGTLTPEESQQLSQLLHELEQEEWQTLRPALQQMRDEQSQLQQEKAMLQAQNAVLAAIAERQADLLARAKAQLTALLAERAMLRAQYENTLGQRLN